MAMKRRVFLPSKQLLPRFITSSTASSSSSSSSPPAAAELPQTGRSCAPPVTCERALDLHDTEKLFASTPSGALLRSLANLKIMAWEPVVDLGIAVVRSKAVEHSAAARAVVVAALKATAYRHFCAGENVEEACKTLQGLWDDGLQGILDYGMEDAEDNAGCDANLAEFLKTVEMTSRLPISSVSFACVKITAICPVSLLERVSDLLRWEQKDPAAAAPWRRHQFPVLCDASPLYHTPSVPAPLTPAEERDLEQAHRRLAELCGRCADVNLPLLVDAEYTSVQPAIDYLAYDGAARFNRGPTPIVYTTVQAYLKDSKERLAMATAAAEKEGITMGFKLVRGAYMTREVKLATSLGVAPPIHRSIQETHRCYNTCALFMLEKAAHGGAAVVLATHNLESGKVAAAKVDELRMGRGNERVQFAQLKGMAEGLSLGLRNAGFNVSKYLAFGQVDKVIPYLLRRAEENRGLLSASSMDRDLIWKELKRRLTDAVLRR
ncbi:unnamed protein product [Spirodela intermedia]|uniref:Proline dehydrogenase n=1 Tax=Spirodela intermedia TaxID=51605 RepID=A0A7I8K1T6_SPIIN|nr:unnamed protein product [Spirodela intermedia]